MSASGVAGFGFRFFIVIQTCRSRKEGFLGLPVPPFFFVFFGIESPPPFLGTCLPDLLSFSGIG